MGDDVEKPWTGLQKRCEEVRVPYDLAVIRKLVDAAFGSEDLSNFCFDYFHPVYDQFTAGQTKGAQVRLLIDHALRHGRLDELLDRVQEANPRRYAEFEPRLKIVGDEEPGTPEKSWLESIPSPPVPHFVGREGALAAYREKLRRERLVIIKGMAGVGKTTLGAKLAREEAEREEQIFWFTFDTEEKKTAEGLFRALAAFLESRGEPTLRRYLQAETDAHRPPETDVKLNLLRAGLSSGDYLLCFDDFQEVKDVTGILHFFERVRRPALPARFIIMGREVPSEVAEYRGAEPLGGFIDEEAGEFVEARGLALKSALLQQLRERTEGNPKLLELSVSALAGMGGNQAAMGRFIEAMARKEESIRDYVMNEIYDALEDEERRVAGVLSVFPTPVEWEVAEEVLAGEEVTRAVPLIYALVSKSVVSETEDERIHCHSMVREYCYRVLDWKDKERVHQRAADCYEQVGNYLAAAHHHFQRGAEGQTLALLTTQTRAIINTGGAGALLKQLGRFERWRLSPEQWVALCQARGDAYEMRGEYKQAVEIYEAGLEEATGEEARAELLHRIGFTHRQGGEYGLAIEYFMKGLNISESLGNRDAMAHVYHDIGWAYYRLDRLEEARERFIVSREMGQELGDRLLLAKTGLGLGVIDWRERQLEEAQARLEESRRIFRAFGDRMREAEAVVDLGLIYGEMGDLERELSCYRQAVEIQEGIGDVSSLRIAYNNLGNLYHLRGDHVQAVHYYSELAQLAQHSDQNPMLSTAYSGMADAHLAMGNSQQALEYAQKARRVAQDVGPGVELGVSCRALGDIWLAREDPVQAKACFEQSIPLLEEAKEDEELAKAHRGLERALEEARLSAGSSCG